jgi:hypothetical protein
MGVPRRRARRFPTPKAGQPTLCLVKQRWVRVSGRDRHPLFVKAETLVRTNGFCSHRPEARRCPSQDTSACTQSSFVGRDALNVRFVPDSDRKGSTDLRGPERFQNGLSYLFWLRNITKSSQQVITAVVDGKSLSCCVHASWNRFAGNPSQ